MNANRVLLALVSFALGGCHAWTSGPIDPSDTSLSPSLSRNDKPDGSIKSALANDAWILRVDPPTSSQNAVEPRRRWRHVGLEDILSHPQSDRPNLSRWLYDDDPIVAANSAIGLARLSQRDTVEPLGEAVRNPGLKLAMRQAAAESLAEVKTARAREMLQELLTQYGQYVDGGYLPELHTELIRAYGRFGSNRAGSGHELDPSVFIHALQSPSPLPKLAAFETMPPIRFEMQDRIIPLCQDRDPRVRAAAVMFTVDHDLPSARDQTERALHDPVLNVRLAAIRGLGKLVGEDSRSHLHSILQGSAEKMRVAAVDALFAMNDSDAVLSAVHDKSWRVRRAVAANLRPHMGTHSRHVARDLMSDPSPQVARQLVSTIANWPLHKEEVLAQAGSLLVQSLSSSSVLVRKEAAALLAEHWPAARDFDPEAPPVKRQSALVQLKADWNRDHPSANAAPNHPRRDRKPISPVALEKVSRLIESLSDPRTPESVRAEMITDLVEQGPPLIDALAVYAIDQKQPLPESIYREVLPQIDAIFDGLDQLASADLTGRRQAMESLGRSFQRAPWGDLALQRLADLVVVDRDPVVWQRAQAAIAEDARPPSVRLHVAGLSHENADVRRRSCQFLGRHAAQHHQTALMLALEDSHPHVAAAAAQALAKAEKLDSPLPLIRLLASRNAEVRLVAATTLGLHGETGGDAALERLALHNDFRIRRQAVQAMGKVARTEFARALAQRLDDQTSIRRAAVVSLEQIFGPPTQNEKDQATPNLEEQVRYWKRRFEKNRTADRSPIGPDPRVRRRQ